MPFLRNQTYSKQEKIPKPGKYLLNILNSYIESESIVCASLYFKTRQHSQIFKTVGNL